MEKIALNLTVPVGIGEINNKKIEALSSKFAKDFPNIIKLDNHEFVIASSERLKSIDFRPNQIIINHSNINNEAANEVQNFLKVISDLFMFDDIMKSMGIRFINTKEMGKDTLKITKSIADNIIINKWNDVSGVGFRYLMKNDNNVFDEFKFEPLLIDNNKFYFEGFYNIFNIDINKISNIIISNLNRFKKMREDIIEDIINERLSNL